MNKQELVTAIAEKADMSKAEAERALNATTDVITKALKSGDAVQLIGFGTFSVKKRAAREGRNPRTGETLKIAACKAPAFKAGSKLKAAV